MEIKHVVFNPSAYNGFGYSPLSVVCENAEKDGFKLVKVVTHSIYESVAVFEREWKRW